MTELERELKESGIIHFSLPLHRERSLEALTAGKTVLKKRKLEMTEERWHAAEGCTLQMKDGHMSMKSPLYYPRRPHGDLEHGDCGNFGMCAAECAVPRENWEDFNRISFRIRVEARGVRKVCGRLMFHNDGSIKLPDPYHRDGVHAMNLIPGETTEIHLEIPTLPRDCVTAVVLDFYCGGCETDPTLGNELTAEISDFLLEEVENTEVTIGWLPAPDRIVYSFSGYRCEGEKKAVVLGREGEPFLVKDTAGTVVLEGTVCSAGFHGLSLMDFSELRQPGRYVLETGNLKTEDFEIGSDIWLPSVWKTINFLFCERCGYPVPGVHQTCHRDVTARHNGKSFVFHGGWHDAGDLSQQVIQSAEVTWSLFELAEALPEERTELRVRLWEEALWGLDYVLRSRFGDGYRATSIGTAMWSRGFMGDEDDINARMHNNAYENYLCSAVECFSAECLKESDPGLAEVSLAAAKADFDFAERRFAETGFSERPPIYWEHSWMTSESAFQATAALAASLLYRITGEDEYRIAAANALRYVISCQETENICPEFPDGGFFYRNPEKKVIVHFSHQARDQIYAQALTEALKSMPDHSEAPVWREALLRHGKYLKRLMDFASPYGMIPAGLYRMEEREDRDSFERQHLETGEEGYTHFAMQLQAGKEVGEGFFLRQFPVWFSFKGNNAVILSMAKAAALCARETGDPALTAAAEKQLQWNTGCNPFCQSLMYGEGIRYAQQYAAMSGEAAGELPVGVQTLEDEDEPYWPQMNNATYKEVWTTPAARWLSVLAELYLKNK